MRKRLMLVIIGTIFVAFMFLFAISSFALRYFVLQSAHEKAEVIAELVQNGLTAHMLSGTMEQREFFLNKIASSKGVESLWVVRSSSVVEQFGKGYNNETVRDKIDERVLTTGLSYKEIYKDAKNTKLRVTSPYIAKEHTTPNCMSCHTAKEGEVLGSVSMVFDIENMLRQGIYATLVILGFSLIIMVLMYFIIQHTMSPLMDLFHSITFVMDKAQNGDYRKRVRFNRVSKEGENVAFWINSLLDKLELTLNDIEDTIKKFLYLKPSNNSDLLLEAQGTVHNLAQIYQFKRTIEFDEEKEQVYKRIGVILRENFGLDDFMLIESGKGAIHPSIVFDASKSTPKPVVDPSCRALRTKQTVFSDQFKEICSSCPQCCKHYLCIPYLINNDFELLLSITAPSQEALNVIKEKLPLIQNYIDAARPELVNKSLMQILKVSSTTDPLTGLFNRKYLDEYIEKALAQAKRNGIIYGVLMIDIDYFKMVNDTYGHDVGDKTIKALSKILKENIRESDTPFRFGGEEFLVLLYECDIAMVTNVAEKIRMAFEKTPIQANNGFSFYKTFSVGASIFPNDSDSLWKCIKFSDIALYNAKESGRNCVKIFNSQMIKDEEMKSKF